MIRNHNNAVTIPVLIRCEEIRRDGHVRVGKHLIPVRVLPLPRLDSKFEKEFGQVPEKSNADFLRLLLLIVAINNREQPHLAPRGYLHSYVTVTAHKTSSKIERVWERVKKDPNRELAAELNHRLRGAKPVIWWVKSEHRLAPGLYCRDIATALFAQLHTRLQTPKGLAVCLRCEKPFIRSKRIQRYCSSNCGAAARMSQMRQRTRKEQRSTNVATEQWRAKKAG